MDERKKILIIEDEDLVGRMIKLNLDGEGFETRWIKSAERIYEELRTGSYDLIIMDVMLPGKDGISATGKLRDEGVDIPVLMVTARDRIEDKLKGFESGADDYLTKPFKVEELIVRVKNLLKRR